MYEVDINPTLNLITEILHRVGIWREWERNAIKWFYMFSYLLLEIFLVACALVSENRNEFTFLSLILVMIDVVGIKLVYLLFKKDEILKFLHKTTKYREDMSEKHVRRINFFLKFVNGYICMLLVAAIFYNVSCLPWLTKERKLPFFIRFTWKGSHSTVLYCICYVFVGAEIFYANICNLTTTIIWYLMLNFAIDYEILGNKLSALGANRMTPVSSSATRDKQFLQDLIGLVKAHQNLFKSVELFRSCFLTLFSIQMITSGITVCISTFNLAFNSQTNNFLETVVYLVVMLYAFFDVFMVMYFGNEIKITSDQLSYRLFESDWLQEPTVVKRSVLFIGEILKRPHQLVILIYPMDLQTLTMIIKGAYTMFNVLQNFN